MKYRIAYGTIGGSVFVPAAAEYVRRLLPAAALCTRPTVFSSFGETAEEMTLPGMLTALSAGWKAGTTPEGDAALTPAEKLPEKIVLSGSADDLAWMVTLLLAAGASGEAVFSDAESLPPLLTIWLSAHGAVLTSEPGRVAFSGCLAGGDCRLSRQETDLLPLVLEAMALTGKSCRLSWEGDLSDRILAGVDMTLDALAAFGCEPKQEDDCFVFSGGQKLHAPGTLPPEGDWDEAAVWLCAGALSKKGITVRGLNLTTSQPSRAVLNLMALIGASVRYHGSRAAVTRAERNAFETEAPGHPAVTAALAAVAAFCEGRSEISGCGELADSLAAAICALGGRAEASDGSLAVWGMPRLPGGALFGEEMLPLALLCSMRSDGEILLSLPDSLSPFSRRLLASFAALGGHADPQK